MRRGALAPWLFLAPAALIYTLFRVVPMLGTVGLSFTDLRGTGAPSFVGLGNYARLLADPVVWLALRNNALWALAEVVVSVALGLATAVLLNSRIRLRAAFRTALFLPVVLSWAVAGLLWERIYNPAPTFGILNGVLRALGQPQLMHNWLGDPATAFWAIVVAAVWKGFGFSMIIFLAGLQDIPPDLTEAAQIDGASDGQVFWRITVPLLRPVVSVVLVLGLIGAFRVFDPVWVMTQGGPGNATTVLGVLVFQTAFAQFNLGYGSTLSVALLACALIATLTYFRVFGQGEAH